MVKLEALSCSSTGDSASRGRLHNELSGGWPSGAARLPAAWQTGPGACMQRLLRCRRKPRSTETKAGIRRSIPRRVVCPAARGYHGAGRATGRRRSLRPTWASAACRGLWQSRTNSGRRFPFHDILVDEFSRGQSPPDPKHGSCSNGNFFASTHACNERFCSCCSIERRESLNTSELVLILLIKGCTRADVVTI